MVEEPRGRSAPSRQAGAGAGRPIPLSEVSAPEMPRLETGIGELDRVLGGGTGAGLGGAARRRAGHRQVHADSTWCSATSPGPDGARSTSRGEESTAQVALRADRLAGRRPVRAGDRRNRPRDGRRDPRREQPDVCVIDSVQTLDARELTSAAGSVAQVREVAARIVARRQGRRIAVLLVGHVTKDGALAGPRVLEHLVDCVLAFEGERERSYRTLRAIKNRFGPTNEAGVFEMRQGGLVEVLDASARFVKGATRAPGSVVLAAMEGSRPLLVEVQALVSPSALGPPPRRQRPRPQPPGARARRPDPPRRTAARRIRRLRQRRRRRARRRARRRPRRGARRRERGARRHAGPADAPPRSRPSASSA